jgi:p-cumate 2,3-dioxygenase beta subunit
MTVAEPTTMRRLSPKERGALKNEIEDFLYDEASLLDSWCLHEWLELFAPRGRYLIPTNDLPDGDPGSDLFLVQDDKFLLEQRVNSLLTRAAHAEYPHSSTRRIIGNVRPGVGEDGLIHLHANFAVFRTRNSIFDTYVGHYKHVLERDGDELRFLVRRSVLDLDVLRPQGKISIIL